MALNTTTKLALAVAFFGSLSFILGVIAENKKPPFGTPIKGRDVVICKFPSDPTIALGIFSIITIIIAAVIGHVAVFFPYNGKSAPTEALRRSTTLVVYFIVAEIAHSYNQIYAYRAVSALAVVMMMWATITEGLHRSRNAHHDLDTQCPTAKTGLFGGAAFLALDASLFWLVCHMLTLNARADYFDEGADPKGDYGQVYAAEVDSDQVGNKV